MLDEFDVDLCLTFQATSWSNVSMLETIFEHNKSDKICMHHVTLQRAVLSCFVTIQRCSPHQNHG